MASSGADHRPPQDPAATRRLTLLSAASAAAALLLGAAAVASYPLGWPLLRSAGRVYEVQFNAGLGLILLGASLLLALRDERAARAAARMLALAGAALGAATLVEHLSGVDLGIDQALYPATSAISDYVPGRMGPPAAVSLVVLGAALAVLSGASARAVRRAHALALLLLPVPFLGVVGHAYDVTLLYGAQTVAAVAFPAAVAVLLLDLGVLLARPDLGLLASLAGAGAGSTLARRMLAYVLALPTALGGVVLAVAGGARGALAVSALVVALTLLFALLVLRDARALDRMELAKEHAQRDRDASREELSRALVRERAARAQAEAASRARDEFLATLSHELRTPLNAILGWTVLLRDGRVAPETAARGVAVIDRNGRALAALVSDLLDMSRVAAGTLAVTRVEVDLCAAVQRAVAAVRAAAEARQVELRLALPATPVVLEGDGARLEQVAWNLVANAVKFSAAGGRVEVSLGVEGGEAVLDVHDAGTGMDPSFLARVFEPFVQADASASRHHGGLGIGLAITRALVVAHGGRIEAASSGRGRGSTFRVHLPGARLAPAEAADRTGADLDGARVLVVDDEADSREVLLQLLATWGVRAFGAGSAREALDVWRRERPDVILSDLAMPGEDGFALVAELRRLEGTVHVPAAAVTAFSRPEDRARALAAGFDAHLGKPIEPAALRVTLASLVREARALARAAAPAAGPLVVSASGAC
jgi:signal transduction histidine kinase/ActR/RegA family two-component response regulator